MADNGFQHDTDVQTKLPFATKDSSESFLSLKQYLYPLQTLFQSLPWIVKFTLKAIFIPFSLFRSLFSARPIDVTIFDARKANDLDFHKTGFTLIELDDEPITKDWRSNTWINPDAEIVHFHRQMEPYIKKLYPDVKKMVWTANVVRGGDKLGDNPKAVGAPHLDYHQDDKAREDFHSRYPYLESELSESCILSGKTDSKDYKLKVLLGIWKPINPTNIVYDYPLAVMDARTFKPDQQATAPFSAKFGNFVVNNLASGIKSDRHQKWYYYSYQKSNEVLVFHQYSKDKFLCNPHTSFFTGYAPHGIPERVSVECRLALYF